jgi:hypothetical protein
MPTELQQWTATVSAIAAFFAAFAWPVVGLVFLCLCRDEIRVFVKNLRTIQTPLGSASTQPPEKPKKKSVRPASIPGVVVNNYGMTTQPGPPPAPPPL